jgi:glycosyltransferase involved in cell wall biosynthesis
VNVFMWHVHGSWTTSFVQGPHRYFLPALPGRGPYGLGRAETWQWPASVLEVSPSEAADAEIDVVILQRLEEFAGFAEGWLGGRRPGRDIPAIYVEHNAPQGRIGGMRHPVADEPGITVVHVTYFNALFWDVGQTPSRVIEHGIVDPGYRYSGEIERAAVVVNEPIRRGRVTGTDLLGAFREVVPLDIFGMKTGELGGRDVPQHLLHDAMARRRLYLHPIRWTSLGLSLLEAMHLGMPVVALATTEAPEAIPPGAGVVSNRFDVLADSARWLLSDPEEATAMGKRARAEVLGRYGLDRFLRDWDACLQEVQG